MRALRYLLVQTWIGALANAANVGDAFHAGQPHDAGVSEGELSCLDSEESPLILIQRRAKAKEARAEPDPQTSAAPCEHQETLSRGPLPTAARIDLALGDLIGLVQGSWPFRAQPGNSSSQSETQRALPQSLVQTLASRLLDGRSLSSSLHSSLQYLQHLSELLRRDRNTGWAALVIAAWGVLFCSLVSFFLHSVLCARSACPQDPDSRVSCPDESCQRDASGFLEKADRSGCWHLTFSWLDGFLGGGTYDKFTPRRPHAGALKDAWLSEVRQHGPLKASLWRALFRALNRRTLAVLFLCAWLSAFLEFIGMVLALDVILSLLEREAKLASGCDALQTTVAVLGLLFVVPLAYRFLSAVVCMLDGNLATSISADVTALLYEKSLRLPAGCMYHSHAVGEGQAAPGVRQLASTMAASVGQEWPQMFKTLALLSAAPLAALALIGLLLYHLGLAGLLGLAYVLPGSGIAILVVKWAISWRHEYQLWQNVRHKWLRALASSRSLVGLGCEAALVTRISAAREQELSANQNYSVVVSLLIANLHCTVWLVVVGSLLFSVLLEVGTPARNVWACSSLLVSGLRRALCLPSSLQRIECFLKQPEMPLDVVRSPALHSGAPAVHVCGNFSFEEGGPLVLRDLDFSVQRGECVALLGPPGSGKTALLQAILGELFPCGLSYVSATHRRSYWAQEPWIAREAVSRGPSTAEAKSCKVDGRVELGPSSGDLAPNQRARLMLTNARRAEVEELILLDDALSLLAPEEAEEMLEACVFSARAQGAARVVVLTRPSPQCLKRFDRVAVLGAGRLVARGPPSEVLAADLDHLLHEGAEPEAVQLSRSEKVVEETDDELAPETTRQPLSVLHQALLSQEAGEATVDLRSCQSGQLDQAEGMKEARALAAMWLQAGSGAQLGAAFFLVLLQRCAQLAQLLVLARWGDVAMRSIHGGCDHKRFAVLLLVALASNAVLLVTSEWACSRAAREASRSLHDRLLASMRRAPGSQPQSDWREAFACDLTHVDSVMLSSLLSGLRSLLGTVLQQAYILTMAPQWLAFVVLLPLYACICYFSWVYLGASQSVARTGRLYLAEGQAILDETLTDPVSVRSNGLSGRVAARYAATMKASAAFANVLPAAIRSWVCFRVALCLSFAASACALHVLLCDEAQRVGVGTLGLIVSLLFAFLADFEAACEVWAQAAVALSALGRLARLSRGPGARAQEPGRIPSKCAEALTATLRLSAEDLPADLAKSGPVLRDSSGPLLEFLGKDLLRPVQTRSLANLSGAAASYKDYAIVSANGCHFDAQAIAEELLAASASKGSFGSSLTLGLLHPSILKGVRVSFEKVTASLGPPGVASRGLKNVSLELECGAHVAIVGPPGSGKSTLLAAAAGLLHCEGVSIQGRPPGEGLEGLVGLVAQEPVVWEGTWRENLDLEDRFTDAALWEALRGVGLADLVFSKPQGLAAHLARDGDNLSLGQRHLLGLARAALRRPSLLLLDDSPALRSPSACQTVKAILEGPFRNSTVIVAVTSKGTARMMGLTEIFHLRNGSIST